MVSGEMSLHRYIRQEQARYGTLFVLPSLVFFAVFVVYPVAFSFYLGFFDVSPLDPQATPVGLANYAQLLTDATFGQIVLNTAIFTAGVVSITLVASLALAVALNQGLRGTTLFRGIFYSPVVTAVVATAVLWTWILDPQNGIVNRLLRGVHVLTPGWASDPVWAMPTVILTFAWREVGYFTVIYLAGLQGIPEQLQDAARIDGCGRLARLRYLTIPLLMPTTLFVLVLGVIRATQQSFGLIYVMTQGGPVNATNVIVLYLYQQAFQFFRLGYASAVAYVLFLFVFVVTLVQFRVLGRRSRIY
jgi:multiple sugar transport system permease protein